MPLQRHSLIYLTPDRCRDIPHTTPARESRGVRLRQNAERPHGALTSLRSQPLEIYNAPTLLLPPSSPTHMRRRRQVRRNRYSSGIGTCSRGKKWYGAAIRPGRKCGPIILNCTPGDISHESRAPYIRPPRTFHFSNQTHLRVFFILFYLFIFYFILFLFLFILVLSARFLLLRLHF